MVSSGDIDGAGMCQASLLATTTQLPRYALEAVAFGGMILVLLIVLSSCEKDFLEEDLRSGLSLTGFYNNLNEAQMAVNGVYATLNNQNLYRNRNYRGAVQYGSDEV